MDKRGLSSQEAKKRLRKYGRNKLIRKEKVSWFKIFISQFRSPLIMLLIIAAIISLVVGFLPSQEPRYVDAGLIFAIVLASGLMGFFQDYKAEKTIEALQKMATPKAKVIRNGRVLFIRVTKIVPGDLILLEEGDIVPADAKIIEGELSVDESILTGESRAISKSSNKQVYMNSSVYTGSAKALVEKTGMQTKMGDIADKLQKMQDEKTQFQKELDIFSKKVFWFILGLIVIMFFIGMLKYDLYQSLLISISLAVAAIPEGLPAVVILTLTIGAKVMANKNVLIRRLPVVESAGAIDIICTD
ncbi:MAG: HAD-IC family P-type ATPase, partial [Candidatus Nanoarchaeia archaeon]